VSAAGGLLRELTRINAAAFNFPVGLREGLFVTTPLFLGVLTGQSELVYVALGALFLTNTDGPRPAVAPLHILLAACFTEALAFGLGTVAGTTGLFAIALIGIAVSFFLAWGIYPRWATTGMTTAIFFAVGVGLPGGSVAAAGDRVVFAMLGALWALSGLAVSRLLSDRRKRTATGGAKSVAQVQTTPRSTQTSASWLRSDAFSHAVIVGAASACGLATALALGLIRDFWVVVTIILALRQSFGPTVSSTAMIILGTAVGAIIAAAITLEITNEYALWVLLLIGSIALFSTRGMNLGLSQVFTTPFIIILLNLVYHGEWYLAEVRILDVAIGGAISILAIYLTKSVRRPADTGLRATKSTGSPRKRP
jgi:uncharacterized membrane protein YccC